ncbi:hypothetical protein [Ruegeria halocynthiae]|uniref:hypothetical protein n=1 Tax=Ruegeria halocynthiae TaxID=985054 RepID=UPI000565C806|nr:hypothetical protein [Ruegeria halocynthiae]
MNYVENEKQKQALTNWLAQAGWTVFGTLKFTDGYSTSEHKAGQCVRRFFNELDRTYIGRNLADNGHRIERAVFRQLGSSGSNLHFHFVAKPNANIENFCETARCVWDETSSFTMGYEHTIIEKARSAAHTARYGLHEFDKLGADTLYLPATHFSKLPPSPKPIHTFRRLTKRQAANELTKETALMRVAVAARRAKIAGQTATH